MRTIDLNCDLGESPESVENGTDEALMALVSSASVACGGHAGTVRTMERSVRSARGAGVAIGAHPGYPDREGFGREPMDASPEDVERFVREQVEALAEVAARLGARIAHVKPHGALYHAAMREEPIAQAIAHAAAGVDRQLVLFGFAGSPTLALWRSLGFPVAAEAFADRRYESDGSLRARRYPDALLTSPGEAADQALAIAEGRSSIGADSLCIHGDTPNALAIARAVRSRLENAGFRIAAPRPCSI